MDAQARFLENEGVNNKEVDARISFYDREVVGGGGGEGEGRVLLVQRSGWWRAGWGVTEKWFGGTG